MLSVCLYGGGFLRAGTQEMSGGSKSQGVPVIWRRLSGLVWRKWLGGKCEWLGIDKILGREFKGFRDDGQGVASHSTDENGSYDENLGNDHNEGGND